MEDGRVVLEEPSLLTLRFESCLFVTARRTSLPTAVSGPGIAMKSVDGDGAVVDELVCVRESEGDWESGARSAIDSPET